MHKSEGDGVRESGQWLGVIDLTRDLEGEAKDGVVEGSGGGYDEDLVIDVY